MLTRVSVPMPLACLATASLLMATACGSNPGFRKIRRPTRRLLQRRPRRPRRPVRPGRDLDRNLPGTLRAGERELKLGHLERARVEFDRAVDVCWNRRTARGQTPGCGSISTG